MLVLCYQEKSPTYKNIRKVTKHLHHRWTPLIQPLSISSRNDACAYMYSYISSSRDCSGTRWRKCPLSLLAEEILDIVLMLLDLRFWLKETPSSSIVGISSTRIPRPADEFRAGGALLYWYCWSGRKTSDVGCCLAVAVLFALLFILGDADVVIVSDGVRN